MDSSTTNLYSYFSRIGSLFSNGSIFDGNSGRSEFRLSNIQINIDQNTTSFIYRDTSNFNRVFSQIYSTVELSRMRIEVLKTLYFPDSVLQKFPQSYFPKKKPNSVGQIAFDF